MAHRIFALALNVSPLGVVLGAFIMSEPITPTTIVAIVGFATMIVQNLFSQSTANKCAKQVEKQHEWERQERAEKATELRLQLESDARTLQLKTDAATAELKVMLAHRANAAEAQTESIKSLVAENTEITKQGVDHANHAYAEANSVNEKIAGLSAANNGILHELASRAEAKPGD